MRSCRLCLLPLYLLAVAVVPCAAVDRPTNVEWEPIAEAIEQQGHEARDRLEEFIRNRRWTEGWVKLAQLDLRAGDHVDLAEHAAKALEYAYADLAELKAGVRNVLDYEALRANAAYLRIYGLNHTGRPAEGAQVLEEFGNFTDPEGLVHLHGAESWLLIAQDKFGKAKAEAIDTAMNNLRKAKAAAGSSLTQEFYHLEARIHQEEGDYLTNLDREGDALSSYLNAATSYEQAFKLGLDRPDDYFNAGRLWFFLARASDREDERETRLDRAIKAFERAARYPGNSDPEAWLKLGDAHLLAENWGDAYQALKAAIELLADSADAQQRQRLATAHALRGRAALELASASSGRNGWPYDRALEDLLAARDLGADTLALHENTLVAAIYALSATTDPARRGELNALIDETRPKASAAAAISLARASYDQAKEALAEGDAPGPAINEATNAATLLATDLGIDPGDSTSWSTAASAEDEQTVERWRYLGHSLHLEAELRATAAKATATDEAADDAAADEASAAQIAALRDRAAAAWRIAGNLGDRLARDHYLTHQSQRDPTTAYAASWTYLGWKNYLSISGWATAIGNYGAAGRWRDTMHIAIWSILGAICLLLFAKGFFLSRGKDEETPRRARPARGGGRDAKHAPAREGRGGRSGGGEARAGGRTGRGGKGVVDSTLLPDSAAASDQKPLERRTPAAAKGGGNQRKAIDDVARRIASQQQSGGGRGGRGGARRRR
ncbi:MAG: tetratricopeptide repeat protein [Planctomycetota bacterium]